MDYSLVLFYLFWFVGNYYYNVWNKLACNESGGKEGGLAVTISVMQLAVCGLYAIGLWIIGYNPVTMLGLQKPVSQPRPKISLKDVGSMMALVVCYAAAHSAGVVTLNAGSVAFGQIVKAAEPVFSAIVNTFVYGKSPSLAKWLCLPLIVGGVAISTLKPNANGSYSIEMDQTALIAGSICNLFAAFKGSENKKMIETPGLKDRLGSVGNQFGVTNILAFLVSLPVMVAMEGANWPKFVELFKSNASFRFNLVMSGVAFYVYNELATMTIKKTGAVTASVANTAKRAFIIVGVAVALGKTLRYEEKVGAAVAIGAVMLYSLADHINPFARKKDAAKTA